MAAISFELGGEWPRSHRRYATDHMQRVSEAAQDFLESESLAPVTDKIISVLRAGRYSPDWGYLDDDDEVVVVFGNDMLAHRSLNFARSTAVVVHEISHVIRASKNIPTTLAEHWFDEGLAYVAGYRGADYTGGQWNQRGRVAKIIEHPRIRTEFVRAFNMLAARGLDTDVIEEELMDKRTCCGLPLAAAYNIQMIGKKLLEGQRLVDMIGLPYQEVIGDVYGLNI